MWCNFSKSFIHAFRIWVLLLCGNRTISNFLKVVNYYPIQHYHSKLVNPLQIPQPESSSPIFEPWVPYLNHSAHPEPFYPDQPCFLAAPSSSFLGSYHLTSLEWWELLGEEAYGPSLLPPHALSFWMWPSPRPSHNSLAHWTLLGTISTESSWPSQWALHTYYLVLRDLFRALNLFRKHVGIRQELDLTYSLAD